MKPLRVSFLGFEHSHVFLLYDIISKRDDMIIVATSESDVEALENCKNNNIVITNDSHFDLLQVDTDIVCIGTNYGARGNWVIKALQNEFHVLSDKPYCTSIDELHEIQTILNVNNQLQLFAQLDLRQQSVMRAARNVLKTGELGRVLSLNFTANHPLCKETRPRWYWDPAKHGGTINDIGCHGFDIIPWLIGCPIKNIDGAFSTSTINSGEQKGFPNIAQVLFSLEDGTACMADLSYSLPDKLGYSYKEYWSFLFWCEKGILEFGLNKPLTMQREQDETPVEIVVNPFEYTIIDEFIRAIKGSSLAEDLTTEDCLKASRFCLNAQLVATKD